MMRRPIFCNNCGTQGHVYNQCKMPITSIGFIVFRKRKTTNEFEYLMIRRKDSLGYVDFIRGNYTFQQKQLLMNLLEEMTVEERERIQDSSNSFRAIWKSMWGNCGYSNNRHEELLSKKKFDLLRDKGVEIQGEWVSLATLCAEVTTAWSEPEWGFPKGRRNYQERDVMCGFREFEEETGLSRDYMNVVSNVIPFEEIYTGSNYKTYKHKYYLAMYENDNVDTTSFQKSEVSKMAWKTVREAHSCIREYNSSRFQLLASIEHTLTHLPLVG